MQVMIPTPLRPYTQGARMIEAEGATLSALLGNLEAQYPGFRFRVVDEQDHLRQHIHLFVNQDVARGLDHPLQPNDVVRIIMAISGG